MKVRAIFLLFTALFLFGGSSYANTLHLGVYIWSDCFNEFKISDIVRFIDREGIKRVELSYRPYFERESVRDLAKRLVSQGIKVDIVLSEPTYIFPEKWQEVRNKLIGIFKSGFNVHLDIEPHILPDFKEKRDEYLKLFVSFLYKVHVLARNYGKDVSVAITVSHYKGAVLDILRSSDLVVFMVYGVKNPNRIEREVSTYDRSKIALALRAKDFKSEKELFEFINGVSRLTGVKAFIIQNLRQWKGLK